jgi:hypothetical protein
MTTETMTGLEEKLDPRRFTAMSGKMSAILACILRTDRWETEPAIAELIVTSDGGLLARHEGDIGANDFIGRVEDLDSNLRRLVRVAGLTQAEQRLFRKLRKQGITRWDRRRPSRRSQQRRA